jgi:hypothetical protein
MSTISSAPATLTPVTVDSVASDEVVTTIKAGAERYKPLAQQLLLKLSCEQLLVSLTQDMKRLNSSRARVASSLRGDKQDLAQSLSGEIFIISRKIYFVQKALADFTSSIALHLIDMAGKPFEISGDRRDRDEEATCPHPSPDPQETQA